MIKYGTLHLLFKDDTRKVIEGVSRLTNLSTKSSEPLLYYETVNNTWGHGNLIKVNELLCWELNFKTEG